MKCIYFLGCHSLGRVNTEVIGRIHSWNVYPVMLCSVLHLVVFINYILATTDVSLGPGVTPIMPVINTKRGQNIPTFLLGIYCY